MSSERWREVSRLYHATMARPADARAAFLADACPDEMLRQEVQALLAHSVSAPGFLEPRDFAAAVLALSTAPLTGSIGPYEIDGLLGAGGMGEVYRARDPRLGRDVAIKILPRGFTDNADRLARFEREARILAALNHPNIAAIYGLEDGPIGSDDRARALILELVEGETLEARLARGPLTFDDTLTVATQVVAALEAAHEKGIVHRDLKPANIKITPNGVVKVLDFGLAKMTSDAVPDTGTAGSTRDGLIVGTVTYMSPEQARGRPVDTRADVWAFGCVLYEMLAGRSAFACATATDTLAAIIEREPDWNALPQSTRPSIHRLLKRCLQKEPHRRLHAIADARLDFEEALTETLQSAEVAAPQAATSKRSIVLWAAAAAVALVTAMALWNQSARDPESRIVTRFTTALPADLLLPAVTRNGSRFAFVVNQGNERGDRIYVRRMDQSDAKPIPGTANATALAFSPDGEWITFVARLGTLSQLKKVHLATSAVHTLVEDAGIPPGIPVGWGEDDYIYFSSMDRLLRVASGGGTPQTLVASDTKDTFERVYAPQLLPGGRGVLFTLSSLSRVASGHELHIAVLSVETGQRKILLEGAGTAHYAATHTQPTDGHIVYERNGSLFAVPFDANRLVLKGSPVRVLEGVGSFTNSPAFALSDSGTLVYGAGTAVADAADTLVWVDRQGREMPVAAPALQYSAPRLSPDGRRVAVSVAAKGGAGRVDLSVYDLARTNLSRLTSEGNSFSPVWTPDGKHLIYQSRRAPTHSNVQSSVAWLPADGSAPPVVVLRGELEPKAISADASVMLLRQSTPKVWFAHVLANGLPSASGKLRPFMESAFAGGNMSFSPDGRWVAYDSTESGGTHVYVEAFPGPGGKWPISTEHGWGPRWSHSGRELFYRDGDRMMVVKVETRPTFRVGTPTKLFEARYKVAYDANFDVAPDDQRFLMIKPNAADDVRTLHVVLNWHEELKRLARTN
jgi:eukaryotic-like serine/threonine-protein kinase